MHFSACKDQSSLIITKSHTNKEMEFCLAQIIFLLKSMKDQPPPPPKLRQDPAMSWRLIQGCTRGEAPAPTPQPSEEKKKKIIRLKCVRKICSRCGMEKNLQQMVERRPKEIQLCSGCRRVCVCVCETHTHTHTHTDQHTHALRFSWFVYLPPNSTSLRPL